MRAFRNVYFTTGFIIAAGLLLASFLYSYWLKDIIPQPPERIYNEAGRLVDVPPYPPSWVHPFGVDRQGEDVFWKVIDGAKYTIFTALAVSLLRLAFGTVGGIMYAFYLQKFRFIAESIVRAFRFVPAIFLTMLFFAFIPLEEQGAGMGVLIKQLLVLAAVALPPLMLVIGNDIAVFLQNEFVVSSRLMGADNVWLIRKHVLPYMRPRLFLLFTQQTVQSLLLLVHLGAFQILLGGVKVIYDSDGLGPPEKVAFSLSNEWSGLIGLSYREMMLDQWIVVGPCVAFIVAIFAFKLMGKGLEQVIAGKGKRKQRKKQWSSSEKPASFPPQQSDFEFVLYK
jgi:peptide/nickel transport system permease protein